MIARKLSVIIPSLLFFLISCDTIDCKKVLEEAREETSTIPKPICVVLCDFSSSMDTISMQQVQKKALELFEKNYNQADLRYYTITGTGREAFFSVDMIPLSGLIKGGQGRRISVKNCINTAKNTLLDSLQNRLQVASKSRSAETYIVQSLESAINLINQRDTAHKDSHKIYILSDMLESGVSSFGKIDLEHGMSGENNIKIEQRANNPDLYPYIFNNVTIEVTLLSQKVADRFQLMAFWNLVFRKLGYKHKVLLTN